MRVKKQKRHRKVVRFYSACFGFREPYKVLLDGTLLHHLLSHGLVPPDHALSRLLGGRCLLFATKCIVAEIRSLGPSHTQTLEATKHLIIARCDHEKRVSGTNCIQSVITENNSEHFFVGTQDPDLRRRFREASGVPVIYAIKSSLSLEQPSLKQREFAKSVEEKRLHMTESELQKLFKKRDPKDSFSEGDSDETQEKQPRGVSHYKKGPLGTEDKPQFKRKRAKGPNPLSCKKKQSKAETAAAENQNKNEEEGPGAKGKRSRKRKRGHARKMEAETCILLPSSRGLFVK